MTDLVRIPISADPHRIAPAPQRPISPRTIFTTHIFFGLPLLVHGDDGPASVGRFDGHATVRIINGSWDITAIRVKDKSSTDVAVPRSAPLWSLLEEALLCERTEMIQADVARAEIDADTVI